MNDKLETPNDQDPVSQFEKTMQELESIVAQMESGDLPLQKSLSLFERGINLAKQCRHSLNTAELRVRNLLEQSDDAGTKRSSDDDGSRAS